MRLFFLLTAALNIISSSISATVTATAVETANDGQDPTTSSARSLTIQLHDGHSMPQVGLGVALTGEKTYDAVTFALQHGYRLIDTAAEESYGNEDQVGRAINDFITKNSTTEETTRSNIFVTTKLWDTDHGFYNAIKAFMESYNELQVGTVDMYLIHSP